MSLFGFLFKGKRRHEEQLAAIVQLGKDVAAVKAKLDAVEVNVAAQISLQLDTQSKTMVGWFSAIKASFPLEVRTIIEAAFAKSSRDLASLREALLSELRSGQDDFRDAMQREMRSSQNETRETVAAFSAQTEKQYLVYLEAAGEARTQMNELRPILDEMKKRVETLPSFAEQYGKAIHDTLEEAATAIAGALKSQDDKLDEFVGDAKKLLADQFEVLKQEIADGAASVVEATDTPQVYDLQVREGDGAVVDIHLHDDPHLVWTVNDRRPPFRIEQRRLTAEQAEKIRAKVSA